MPYEGVSPMLLMKVEDAAAAAALVAEALTEPPKSKIHHK